MLAGRSVRWLRSEVSILIPALIVIGLTHGASARPLDDVIASNVLHVVVYDDLAPYSWEENGVAKGIDADIGRAIARELGVKPDILVRMPGEDVDDDLRSNIWQGPRFGGTTGDVMMHVPIDKVLAARNNLVSISNAYFHERIALATHPDLVGEDEGLEAFRTKKIAVQFSTSAHYYLAFALDGAIRKNVHPYKKLSDAAATFLSRDSAGLMAPRGELEAALLGHTDKVRIVEPEMVTALKTQWNIGMAVKEDSRDLGYTIGAALDALRNSGELQEIFGKHGVTYVPPAVR